MKQIFRYIFMVASVAALTLSCNRDFEWEGFGVNNDDSETNCINLKADNGETTISVYSDSEWYAEFEDDYDWATLTNASGKGSGRALLTYEANNKAIRRAFILVHSRGETKRIMVVQSGADIVFRFRAEDGEMNIEKGATTYYLALDSNISSDLYKHVALSDVDYLDMSKDWIKNVRLQGELLAIDVALNDTEESRSARLGITFTDPYTKSVYGPSYVNITQSVTSSVEISWDELFSRYEAAVAASGSSSWTIVSSTEEEASGIKIGAINLSFPENTNAAMNKQSAWSGTGFPATDTSINESTTYVVSPDKRYSMKVSMLSGGDNIIPQYATTQIRVDGCVLKKLGEGRYELSGVRSRNIVSLISGTEQDVPARERKLSELTSDDYYRIVTIKDVELVYNKGALYNTSDGYRYYCDYYPTLLRDRDGNTIYMMFNHKQALEWVRRGQDAPLGKGDVTGILTYETSPAYGENSGNDHNSGGSLGAFVIRPFDESCLQFNASEEDNFSKTYLEWHWLDETITLDEANCVLPKSGEGKLYHELGVVPKINNCFNGLTAGTTASATVRHTACCYNAAWMNENEEFKGLVLEFSAKTLGGGASLNLAYWAGGQYTNGSGMSFPANWRIEYSFDGTTYTVCENSEFDIHPQAWWASNCIKFGAHGLSQRSFRLPAEISGAEKVYIRIVPHTVRCAALSHPEGAIYTASAVTPFYVAAITIKYNK